MVPLSLYFPIIVVYLTGTIPWHHGISIPAGVMAIPGLKFWEISYNLAGIQDSSHLVSVVMIEIIRNGFQ